jgi:hypothetical protein
MPPRARDRLGRPVDRDDPSAFDPGIDVDAPRSAGDAIDIAQRLIDDGLWFTAHEVLEAQWKQCPADERALWQGLAQVAVARTHEDRGNAIGAERLHERAMGHLTSAAARSAAVHHGLDVAAVLAASRTGADVRLRGAAEPG